MKRFVFLFLFLITVHLKAQVHYNRDSIVASIESQITLPVIPEYRILITNFGAKGDGLKDCKSAFDKAMKACSKQNGGTIVVPKGIYKINGPIHFVSHVRLHLEEGATLVFGTNPKDYPIVLTSWEGTTLYNYSPMIYGYNVNNVAITGKGTIDGEGHSLWSTWKSKEAKGKQLSREMNHKELPVEARVFGDGFYLRPQLVQFVNSKHILIEDIKVEDAPFWCVHLLKSESITLRGIRYDAHNKNNDGLDIEQSKNVLIENVTFNNADDNIAIKAGRDNDGRNTSETPSKNIIIRNNNFKGLHAIVIGSEMSAGVENVYAYDNKAVAYVKRGIYLKTNSDRGGFIRNIYVENTQFLDAEDAIYVTSNYHGEGSGLFPSKISNIHISNVSFGEISNTAIVIEGYPKLKVEDVWLDHITIKSAKNGMTLTNTKNVQFNEVVIGEKQTVPSAVN
ncbi:glycoside hydrolase family 28 protein [Gaetbulibacter sp. PBL-D1]|uniref:glycoside hydrolase family 28 protein n=1 Tax=Gaetbulibacter sp. PBL-D1 TaxID=3422594 RepID=UPI003D2EC0C4